jgi:arylsulfatase A-like enzyme
MSVHTVSSRQTPKGLLSIAVAVAALSGGAAVSLAADRKPNVVIIVADGPGRPPQGDKGAATPNIDALAKRGATFTNGYAAAPVPGPNSAALLTGRYPQRFGFDANAEGEPSPADHGKRALDLAQSTLAQDLKAAGYTTGIFGNWYLGAGEGYLPTQRGFDEFYGALLCGNAAAGPEGPSTSSGQGPSAYRGTTVTEKPKDLLDQSAAEASSFIDHHAGEPFFVYLPLAGELGAIDRGVGRVTDKLHERGLEDNTLLIFVNDEHPAGWALLERGIRSSFIVSWNGKITAAQVVDRPVTQLDLTPTVLSAADVGAKTDWHLDGKNLLPLLHDQTRYAPDDTFYWRFGVQYAVLQGNWKLVKLSADARPRFFYLQDDPGEALDLFQQQAERAKTLQALWDAWNAGNELPRWVDDRWNGQAAGNNKPAVESPASASAAGPWKSGDSLQGNQAPDIASKALQISAEIDPAGTEGVIVTQGGTAHGYAVYLTGGKLAFAVREKKELTTIVAKQPLGKGHFLVQATLGEDGTMALLVDGKPVAEGKAAGPIPQQPRGGFSVGKAGVGAVGDYETPNAFHGTVTNVTVKTTKGR